MVGVFPGPASVAIRLEHGPDSLIERILQNDFSNSIDHEMLKKRKKKWIKWDVMEKGKRE